jgi:hypothetical protein
VRVCGRNSPDQKDIIAKFTVTAMKRRGGKSLGSIRPVPRERFGLKHIR